LLVDDPRFDDRKRILLLAHVASALGYVHQRSVVHRDVKLENVLVTHAFWTAPEDPATVKLIDFGIAVQSANPRPLTQAGHIIGTPAYLAPEQLDPGRWGASSVTTARSDVFSFGILAWKLMGRDCAMHPSSLPADARLELFAAAYRRAEDERWPPSLNAQWDPLFAGAIALRPSDRLADGLDLVRAIVAGLRRPQVS
jgi:serine/threonine protein kinase